MNKLKDILIIKNQRGASMLEVALIAALLSVVCIPSLTFFGKQTEARINDAGLAIANAGPANTSSTSVGSSENPPALPPALPPQWLTGSMGGAEGECTSCE
jgi:Flp pilus assembly pilin Flp